MTLENFIKLATPIGGIVTFLWGIFVWRQKSRTELEDRRVNMERERRTRRLDATKPFLERQLQMYTLATQTAAIIATSQNAEELLKAIDLFWRLYWGELAMVENPGVEAAMVTLRNFVPKPLAPSSKADRIELLLQALETDRDSLEQAALHLARMCRKSLDQSWGIFAWTSPDEAAKDL